MDTVRGCYFPEDLLYKVEHNAWVRLEADGTATVGLTTFACALAGRIERFSPRRKGRSVRAGGSCATLESDSWVGSVKSPVSGEIAVINDMIMLNPAMIGDDPYGDGWLLRISPSAWGADTADLATGRDVLTAFEARMDALGFAS